MFILVLSKSAVKECHIVMLINDIFIYLHMVHDNQIEQERLKEMYIEIIWRRPVMVTFHIQDLKDMVVLSFHQIFWSRIPPCSS